MLIKQQLFGNIDNQVIIKYSLIAKSGFQVDVLNYGCIITGIWTMDKNGNIDNVVLNYDTAKDYIHNHGYLGAVIGRHAGRISGGKFSLQGKTYTLAQNHNGNNLHGGNKGLDKKFWQVEELSDGLKLSCRSDDGDEGYPGNICFEVYYQLTNDSLNISYNAFPDLPTIINLTNHSYFNLSALRNLATSQELRIAANEYCPVDENMLPTGAITSVDESIFDFRQAKLIRRDIDSKQLNLTNGYDHPYILNHEIKPEISLFCPTSFRELNISTTEPCVIFYSGNSLTSSNMINNNHSCINRLGICLETQAIPNAINQPQFNPQIYSVDKPYHSTSVWQFRVRQS